MVTVAKGKVKGTGVKPSDRKPAKKEVARAVRYPEMRCDMHLRDNDLGPVTVELAKALLGWEDEDDHKARVKLATPDIEDDKIIFPKDFFLVNPFNAKKVVVTNNSHNRPFDVKHCEMLAQDILNRFWADSGNRWFLKDETVTCNGETIIIGRTGLVLSGQHRLIALIFADYIRKGISKDNNQKAHWDELWKDEADVTLEACIVYGVSESPKVIRTFDNVKPRTFSDVLFTDPSLTGEFVKDKRLIYTRTVDYAIKFLWERTGEKTDSYAPRRTQSEAMEFLLNHPTLKKCAVEVLNADGWGVKDTGKKISNLMSLGDAAGVCYLMACSDHDAPEQYWKAETRREGTKGDEYCNPTRLTQAVEFFKRLASHEDFAGVRTAFGMLSDPDKGVTGGGHKQEKLAILCHCWEAYLKGEAFDGECEKVDSIGKKKPGLILVAETKKDNDRRVIAEYPDFGGIDKGPSKPKPPTVKKLKDTDIDAVLEEAQSDTSDDEAMEEDILEEEVNEEGDGPTEEELDSINDSMTDEDLEDQVAVDKAHKNHGKKVTAHNEKVLKKEKAKDEPKKMTPQNAFDGVMDD